MLVKNFNLKRGFKLYKELEFIYRTNFVKTIKKFICFLILTEFNLKFTG